jgi:hypothetical protein
LNALKFKLDSLLIYNPTFLPKKKKPFDEDFQDAKLLYYYPCSKDDQNKRRNYVGLCEGTIQFIEIMNYNKNKNHF